MTPSPTVTWPSPAMTTVPLRRTLRTVVERIRRFVGMSAILDYSSGQEVGASAPLVLPPSILESGELASGKVESAEQRRTSVGARAYIRPFTGARSTAPPAVQRRYQW